jgi:D-sedoheptulose 7-phosphate isomerase
VSERRAFISGYRDRLAQALDSLDFDAVESAIEILERAWRDDRLVLLAGNGGSAATAEHTDLDLSKTVGRVAGPTRGFRTIAITHGPALSAWANDVGPEAVFAGQVRDLGREGDVLVVFSAMGNSPNIVAAVAEAKARRMETVGLLGGGGGQVATVVDVAVVVDSDDYGVIEDVHLAINHLVTDYFARWAGAPRERTT